VFEVYLNIIFILINSILYIVVRCVVTFQFIAW